MRTLWFLSFLIDFVMLVVWQICIAAILLLGTFASVKLLGGKSFPILLPLLMILSVIQIIASFKAGAPLRLALLLSFLMLVAWQLSFVAYPLAGVFMVITLPFWAFMVMRHLQVDYLWAVFSAAGQLAVFIVFFKLFISV